MPDIVRLAFIPVTGASRTLKVTWIASGEMAVAGVCSWLQPENIKDRARIRYNIGYLNFRFMWVSLKFF